MATIFRTIKLRVTTVTADYQVLVTDDLILADATTGPLTVTLPSLAGTQGQLFIVKRINENANDVTIVGIP